MRKLVLTLILAGISITSIHAQTLFTYGSNAVTKEEFLRVYKKNTNPTKVPDGPKKIDHKDAVSNNYDMSDTALRSYLELYSLFKMKVAEAENEKLDTLTKVQVELDNYRKQLSKNYLTDSAIINKMVKESYERMKTDVHVEHILIACTPGADSMAAYKKMDSIYHLIADKKANFEDLAKQLSDDKGSKDNGGDIGYITSLQTVFQFEDAAFSTPVGKVSKPFRTQFGYHIVKVLDTRADRGIVKVAQILIATPKSRGTEYEAIAKSRADSVEMLLKQGVSWADLVKKYSDDKYTNKDSGVMKPFGTGKMVLSFETAAFNLKKVGDVSEPVKSEYGYHIIKLISRSPIQPFDSLASMIKHKVENDARAQNAKDAFFEKVKMKNGFKEYAENVNEISDKMANSVPDTGKLKGNFKASDFRDMTKPVFMLGGKTYTQNDFAVSFEKLTRGKVTGTKKIAIRDAYKMFVSNVVTDFQEHHLVETNPEFKNLMSEYKDGIMLFELMDHNVWSRASHDSEGLKAFYETKKGKYMWDAGFEGGIYNFKNKASYDTGMLLLNSGNYTDDQIAKLINSQSAPDRVSIQHGHFEFSKYKEATQAELTANKMKIIPNANGTYKVIYAKNINTGPVPKTLDEARGYVVAEYQDFLEKQWNEKMRKQFPVKVDEKVFKSIVKK